MFRILTGALLLSTMSFSAYAASEPANVAKIWVDTAGATLYTFDKDTKGEKASACTGKCIVEWPPFLAEAGAKAIGDWTLVPVVDADGTTKQMWAYDGMPFYRFLDDKKAGDVTGDGKDGFHVAWDK